ncbi:MAG: VOC family protein [Nitriliruptoraceae bacterium]
MPPQPWIHHITLNVTDLKASAEWYGRLLGLDVASERAGDGWRRLFFATDGFLLGLTQHDDTRSDDTFDVVRVGVDHIGVGCRNRKELEGWIEHLDAEGIARSEVTEAASAHLVTCRDPDGIPIEFYWRVSQ